MLWKRFWFPNAEDWLSQLMQTKTFSNLASLFYVWIRALLFWFNLINAEESFYCCGLLFLLQYQKNINKKWISYCFQAPVVFTSEKTINGAWLKYLTWIRESEALPSEVLSSLVKVGPDGFIRDKQKSEERASSKNHLRSRKTGETLTSGPPQTEEKNIFVVRNHSETQKKKQSWEILLPRALLFHCGF